MTQIPEPGSVWVRNHQEATATVVWADQLTVVYNHQFCGRISTSSSDFVARFTPAPKPKIKMQRWVNLYPDRMSCGYPSPKDADLGMIGSRLERRLIEWEVEQD